MRFSIEKLILLSALIFVSCQEDEALQSRSISPECVDNPTLEKCQTELDLQLAITTDVSITNQEDFILEWTNPLRLGVQLVVAEQADCSEEIFSFDTAADSRKIDFLADGQYYFCLFSETLAGERVAAKNNGFQLTVDKTAPKVKGLNANLISNSEIAPEFSVEDLTDVTYAWSSDDERVSFSDTTSVKPSLSASEDGSYDITLSLTDEAGNTDSVEFRFVWDTQPPKIMTMDELVSAAPTISLTAESDSEIATWSWAQISGDSPLTFTQRDRQKTEATANQNGRFEIEVTATDLAGNSASAIQVVTWGTQFASFTSIDLENHLQDGYLNASEFSQSTNAFIAENLLFEGQGEAKYALSSGDKFCNSSHTYQADIPRFSDIAVDGHYKLCVEISTSQGSNYGESATFIKDTVAPNIDLGDDVSTYASVTKSGLDTTANTYQWSEASSNNNVVFSNASAAAPSISAAADGNYTIQLIATDVAGNTASDSFQLTWHQNRPPQWSPTPSDTTVAEDSPISLTVQATDPDSSDTVVYSFHKDNMTCDDSAFGSALSINSSTGAITGTPTNDDVGTCTIHVIATSNGDLSVNHTLTLTIQNTDDTPTWSSTINDFSHAEDSPLSGVTATATDIDTGETPTYSFDTANMTCDDGAWASLAINSTTGDITGTPTNDDVGTCSLKVQATSGGQTISQDIQLTITNTNDVPTWNQTFTTINHNEDVALALDGSVTEVDAGQTPSYAFDSTVTTCDDGSFSPALAIDSSTGSITGTPTNGDVGSCIIKIVATSGGDTLDQTFTVNIANVNDLPTWDQLVGDFQVSESIAISGRTAQATDVDVGETPAYAFDLTNMTCDDGAWSGLAIDNTTGVISGTPANADVGTCTLKIDATSGGDTISENLTVTVSNTNDLPIWDTTIADFTINEDSAITGKTMTASDADAGDTPTYAFDLANMTCDDGAFNPALSINTTTGALEGTPTNDDVGTCTISVVATSNGDSISHDFTLTINNTNDLPTWSSVVGDFSLAEDSSVTGKTAQATDVDVLDSIAYSLDTANMTCDDGAWSGLAIDNTTGVISGTPTNADVGTCTIKIDATSGSDTISETLTATVTNSNDAPTWDSTIADFSINEDSAISGKTAQASDNDAGDTPTYSFDLANMTCDDGAWSGLTINPSTGAISGTPTNSDVGDCTLRVLATSNGDTINDDITVTVNNTNDSPTWSSTVGDFSVAEDSAITGKTAQAIDVDAGETPTYSFDATNSTCDDGAWSGLAIDNTTGVISGTPANSDVGTCTLKVDATSSSDTISETLTVTVTNSNDAPTWDSTIADFSINEDSSISGKTAQASDVDDGETPTYSFDTANMTCDDGTWSGLAIDNTTGVISGTPTNSDVGTCTIQIIATSGSDTITDQFTVTVNNTNDAPTWVANIGDFSAAEDIAISGITAQAIDVDTADTPTYVFDSTNMTCDDGTWTGLAIDNTTGALSGTPANGDVGTCTLKIDATAGSDTISETLTVTVTNANDPPVWDNTIADFNINEDSPISGKTADASDPDVGDTISYSLDTANMTCDNGTWSGLAIDNTTGVISGTPTNSDVGTCTIQVSATSNGQVIQQSFTVTINNTNDLPTWDASIGDFSVAEDAAISGVTAQASDVDNADTPTYAFDNANMTCDNGAWSGLAIDNTTGVISGTPTNSDVGTCTLKIDATSGSDTISETLTITVNNANDAPTWDSTIADFNINEDSAISGKTAQASDVDAGDTPTYALDTANMTCDNGAWSGLAIDNTTGVISGTPTNADVGTCTIQVIATSGSDNITDSFTVTINNTNDLPTWDSSIGDFSVAEDSAISGKTAQATDVDSGDTVAYSFDTANMTCDDGTWSGLAINSSTGVISGTPTNNDVGTCTLEIDATAGSDTISETVTVTVTNANDAPTWDSTIADFSINEDSAISGKTAQATDADAGETPTYTLDTANMTCDDGAWSGLAVDSTTGVISGTPTNNDVGTCTIQVIATSGSDTITDNFTVTVNNTNDTPTWDSSIGDFSIAEDSAITAKTAQATDVDTADSVSYSFDLASMTCDDGAWSGLAINSSTGIISGTPTNSDVGTCTLEIDATAGGETISETLTITVTNSNDAPTWDSTIADFNISEDSAISGKTAQASDVDIGDTIAYSFDTANMTCDDGAWSGLAINSSTGAISGTPTNNDVGTCTIKVLAISNGDTIEDDFTITVNNTNDLPTWDSSIGNFSLAEDSAISGKTAQASDVDSGETPTYAFDNDNMTCDNGAWSGLVINSSTGVISGTPTNSDVGTCTIKVEATSGSDTIDETLTVTVTNSNDAPTWDSTIADFSINEDSAISGKTAQASDVDVSDTPTYSFDLANMTCDDGAWSGLAINSSTGAISGTPTNSDVGDCTLRVLATSNGDTINDDITVTVNNTNDSPTWSSTVGDFSVAEDSAITGKTAQAIDVDAGETPTYSFDATNSTCDDGAWSGLAINSSTGVISGTPTNSDVGTCILRVLATSNSEDISEDFTITVTNSNDAPTWDSTIADFSINEDSALSGKTAQATDVDSGETPAYSLDLASMTCDNGAWSGLAINSSTGVISGTPTNSDVGDCTITVNATSGGDTISDSFTVTVNNTNDLPTWDSSVGDFSVAEDSAISGKTAQATDVDSGETPTYAFDTANMTCDDGAWSGLSINASTGVISGTPTNSDVGTCTLEIDATAGSDTISETLTVTVTNTNDAPTWDSTIADFSVNEDSAISGKTAQATDVDAGDTVVYSLDNSNMTCDNGSWSGLAINSSTGVISGTPTNDDVGTCTLRVVATANGDAIQDDVTVTVVNTNDVPTWDSAIGNFTLAEDSAISGKTAQATDVDSGDTVSYSLDNANMTCDDGAWSSLSIHSSTGVLSGTPTNDDVGTCTIKIDATAGSDTISETLTATITNTDDVPTWDSSIADFSINEDSALTGKVAQASDVDAGDTISYSFDSANMTCDDGAWSSLAINSSTGVLSGTPTNDDVGTCTIKAIATSNSVPIEQTFTVTVNNTNDTPTWSSTIGDFAIDAATAISSKTAQATDVDSGDTITYELLSGSMTCDDGSWTIAPAINSSTGVLSGTPSASDVGTCTIAIRAKDAALANVDETLTVTINSTSAASPNAPTSLAATGGSDNLDFTWSDGGGATTVGYIVVKDTSLISWTPTDGVDYTIGTNNIVCKSASTSCSSTSLSSDTLYYHAVFAYSSGFNYSDATQDGVITGASGNFNYDFEDTIMTDFTMSGNANWSATTSNAYAGSYSAQSGSITDSQSSCMELTFDLTSAGGNSTLSFDWATSSETNYDKLYFYHNYAPIYEKHGITSYANITYNLTQGSSHIVAWCYFKDSSVSSGSDAGYVDNITVTASSSGNITSAPRKITNFATTSTGSSITVNWSDGGGDTYQYLVVASDAESSWTPSDGSDYSSSPPTDVEQISSSTSFSDTGLGSSSQRFYKIYAFDESFNYSEAYTSPGWTNLSSTLSSITVDSQTWYIDSSSSTSSGYPTVSSNEVQMLTNTSAEEEVVMFSERAFAYPFSVEFEYKTSSTTGLDLSFIWAKDFLSYETNEPDLYGLIHGDTTGHTLLMDGATSWDIAAANGGASAYTSYTVTSEQPSSSWASVRIEVTANSVMIYLHGSGTAAYSYTHSSTWSNTYPSNIGFGAKAAFSGGQNTYIRNITVTEQ